MFTPKVLLYTPFVTVLLTKVHLWKLRVTVLLWRSFSFFCKLLTEWGVSLVRGGCTTQYIPPLGSQIYTMYILHFSFCQRVKFGNYSTWIKTRNWKINQHNFIALQPSLFPKHLQSQQDFARGAIKLFWLKKLLPLPITHCRLLTREPWKKFG